MKEFIIKPNEKQVYTVIEKRINNQYLIERSKLPFLKVLYNQQTKKGKLYSFFSGSMPDNSGNKRSITKQDIEAAVKETIAWAKDNIVAN
jgi:enamine deaminase RidA (YjgF/YER057c/UK114 family)